MSGNRFLARRAIVFGACDVDLDEAGIGAACVGFPAAKDTDDAARHLRRRLAIAAIVVAVLALGWGVAWWVAPGEVQALWERVAGWF